MATKKPVKKTTKQVEETIIEVIKPTDEDLFLGADEEIKEVKVVNYTAFDKHYKVTNVSKNRIYTLNGLQIGAILGLNQEARKQLKEGAKNVEVKNNEDVITHKIEVL